HLEKVNEGLLLQDAGNFYVVLNRAAEPNPQIQGPWPNLNGLRSVPVNGMVYAFARDTGKLRWRTMEPVLNQMLLVERFQELPVLIFTAKYNKALKPAP